MVLKIGDEFSSGISSYEVLGVKLENEIYYYCLKDRLGRTFTFSVHEQKLSNYFKNKVFYMVSSNKYKKRIATYE